MKTKLINILIQSTLIALLTGCTSAIPLPPTQPNISVSQSTTDTLLPSLTQKVNNTDAQIIQQGDRLWVVIPIDSFFETQSTTLQVSKRADIGTIAQFIGAYVTYFPNALVRVYGYTDTVYDNKTRQELSEQYAQVIGSSLWNYGISRHHLFVEGYSSSNSIASNTSAEGRALNRRVMIQIN